jgi:methylaspartate ammonia-lyase
MKIGNVLAAPGAAAWYSTDLEAVRRGARTDKIGLIFQDPPVSAGFTSVRQPAQAVCVMIVLDNGHIAYGDCVATTFPGQNDKDRQVSSHQIVALVEHEIAPLLIGCDAAAFRENDDMLVEKSSVTRTIGPAVLYGLSQALLSAAAIARQCPMANILASDWSTEISRELRPLNLQTGPDWARGIDKIILRRGASIHTRNPHNPRMFAALPEALGYINERLKKLAPSDYRPMVHMGLYGLPGTIFNFDEEKICDHLRELERIIAPYTLLASDVVEMKTRDLQIENLAGLRSRLKDAGSKVALMAETFCLTVDDHIAFKQAGAVDYQKIRPLDVGSFGSMMNIAAIRKAKVQRNPKFYLAGSATETDISARARAHLGMAIGADLVLAGPGMGVDEAHSIMSNEMGRILRLN